MTDFSATSRRRFISWEVFKIRSGAFLEWATWVIIGAAVVYFIPSVVKAIETLPLFQQGVAIGFLGGFCVAVAMVIGIYAGVAEARKEMENGE